MAFARSMTDSTLSSFREGSADCFYLTFLLQSICRVIWFVHKLHFVFRFCNGKTCSRTGRLWLGVCSCSQEVSIPAWNTDRTSKKQKICFSESEAHCCRPVEQKTPCTLLQNNWNHSHAPENALAVAWHDFPENSLRKGVQPLSESSTRFYTTGMQRHSFFFFFFHGKQAKLNPSNTADELNSYQVIKDRQKEFEEQLKDGCTKTGKTGSGDDDVYTTIGARKRLAFLDMLLQIAYTEGSLSMDDIREEVDTFMFEVSFGVLCSYCVPV